jgi:hypothetical protein
MIPAMLRSVRALTIGLAFLAGTARADEPAAKPAEEPDDFVFPLQLDVGLQFLMSDGLETAGAHFGFAIVAGALTTLGTDWHVFAGLGVTDTVFTRWQRVGLRAPDAVTGTHAAGLETRVGIAPGTDLGALRFVVKVTPMWVRGVEMALPTDRGLGVRARPRARVPYVADRAHRARCTRCEVV